MREHASTTATIAPSVGRGRGALAGATAAAVALGVGEVVSVVDTAGPSPLSAVGEVFIDSVGVRLKDLAVSLFGTGHRTALVVSMLIVIVGLGAIAGARARHRFAAGVIAFSAAGVIGLAAMLSRPDDLAPVSLISTLAATAAGIGALRWLLHIGASTPVDTIAMPGVGVAERRSFFTTAAGLGAAAVAAGVVGRIARGGDPVPTVTANYVMPIPSTRVPLPTSGLNPAGVSPYITPTDDFFRIDTALRVPRVDPSTWTLTVDGLVDRPFSITYDELLAMDAVEMPVTIACVSNQVGGDLVGTAMWQGVPLADLLDRAGVRTDAEQVVGRSVDRFTAGFPVSALDGERTALVAYAMNGDFLPALHGFPARLVVSGLYGYVSATKWLSRIELATWDGVHGYWIPLGWSKQAPVKIASRIDTPTNRVDAGTVMLGGVALAPSTGISAVEVSIDDEPWQTATLAPVSNDDTWVQWTLDWQADPGLHWIQVRAWDADGQMQTEEVSAPAPNGATGWHRRRIVVD